MEGVMYITKTERDWNDCQKYLLNLGRKWCGTKWLECSYVGGKAIIDKDSNETLTFTMHPENYTERFQVVEWDSDWED